MTSQLQSKQSQPQTNVNNVNNKEIDQEKILCSHCQRTATNGIKCKGMCVADSDY